MSLPTIRPTGPLRRCRLHKGYISLQQRPLVALHQRNSSSNASPSLERTRALLPRILPESTVQSGDIAPQRRLELWNQVLCASPPPSEITLTVFGVDQWSQSRELVTALLRDPFVSDASLDDRIATRWTDTSRGNLTIRKDADTSNDAPDTFRCPSSFFEQFSVPLRIQETPLPHNSLSFLHEEATLQAYLTADIPLIICNPLTTSPADLLRARSLLKNPNTIVVFTHTSTVSPTEAFRERFAELDEDFKVLFVDPYRALTALDVLKANPGSPLSVQQYQDGFIESGIASISRTVKDIISSTSGKTPESILRSLGARTVKARIQSAASVVRDQLKEDQRDCDQAYLQVSTLRDAIARERYTLHNVDEQGAPHAEIEKRARKGIQADMDALSIWRMIIRVDEITAVVSATVTKSFAELQKQLIFDAGRLSGLQEKYASSMTAILRQIPSPFRSPILENEVDQLISSPRYPVASSALLGPLVTRREQIIEYPTARLHVAAQRSFIGLSGSTVTGLAVGWAGWVEAFSGQGMSMLAFMHFDPSTLMGAGGLITVLGLRWALGHWEKSKKKWWADWQRIYDGLERDLTASSQHIVNNQVLVVADKGCSSLLAAIDKRNQQIAELSEEVAALEEEPNVTDDTSN